jgi:uroporphyrinogen-III synthase
MRLLVTRPEPDNARTAAALRARGHEVTVAPLMHVAAVGEADLGVAPWAAILLTSANAARAIARTAARQLLASGSGGGRSSAEAARAAVLPMFLPTDCCDLAWLAAAPCRIAVAAALSPAGPRTRLAGSLPPTV